MGRRLVVVVGVVVSLLGAGCQWGHPRFGPARDGHNPFERDIGVGNVAELREVWSSALPGQVGDPVVANGIVYIPVPGRAGDGAEVHAKDAVTGADLWTLSFAGGGCSSAGCFPSSVSLAVSGGKLFVGRVLTTTGELTAFDARTGAQVRRYTDASTWSPVVADGKVYASSYGGGSGFGITAWDVETGALVFRTVEGSFGFPPLAVSDGYVYEGREGVPEVFDAAGVANCGGSPNVCTPLWTASGFGPPAVAGDTLYAGSQVFDASGCGAPTCTALWATATTGPVGPAAVADGVVYVESGSGLHAFNASGCGAPTCTPLWTGEGADALAPSVANSVVYSTFGQELRAFDASGCGAPTCAPLWTTDSGARQLGWINVSSGMVFVGTTDGVVHAYALPDDG